MVKLILFVLALPLIGVCTGACGEDDAASDIEVLAAIRVLDSAGLHGIDESINEQRTIPANARTVALQAETAIQLTDWPNDLDNEADALAATFREMAGVLAVDPPDLTKSGEIAAKAHDQEHDFSHRVWEYLYDKADVEADAHAAAD